MAETLARVIERTPDLSALSESTPRPIRDLLGRCPTKDPRNRLQAIGEARSVIERAIDQLEARAPVAESNGVQSGRSTGPALRTATWRRAVPWAIAVAALAVAGAVLVLWAPGRKGPAPPAPLRLSAELGVDASLVTEPGAGAVLSPDGQWIAFFASGKLKKISVTGGAAVTLCDAPSGRGGTWAEDGTIAFEPDIAPGVGLLHLKADTISCQLSAPSAPIAES